MERKSTKALICNGVAALFAFVAIIALFLKMFKDIDMKMFDLIRNKEKINKLMDWNAHVWLILGLILALGMIACAVLDYLKIVKFKFMPFVLIGIGVLMVLMAILVFTETSDFRKAGAKLGFGWALYLTSTILSMGGAVGTYFFKE